MDKERARQGAGAQSDPPPRVGDDVRRRLAHDARASLSTIVGWTEIVRQSGADPVLRARAVETVLRHVEQVSRLAELRQMRPSGQDGSALCPNAF